MLTDPKNRLTSWYGEYSPTTKDALFRDRVELHSLRDNDTLDIFSEQMLYNTNTHIAILDTVSTIVSKDGTIHTTDGVYNTDTQQADLYRRSLVVAKNGNTLTGDTLYYDQQTGFGEAFGNIEMVDTAKKVTLLGDYGFYYEDADSARVYGHALAKEYSQADTLYLHGDTISTFRRVFFPEVADDEPRAMLPAMAPVAVESISADSISADSISDGGISAGVMALDSMAVDSIPVDSVAAVPVIPDSVAAVMMPADSVATAIPPRPNRSCPTRYIIWWPTPM